MIYTFYSYKGGVGRSMALANVAHILALGGLSVLMVDFDLEAPGLEEFFPINQSQVRRHLGLLDLLMSYKRSMSVAAGDEGEDQHFRLLKEHFLIPVYDKLPKGGRLDLLPAGQREGEDQLARYALNLRTFDWQDFYFNWAGGVFFEWLRHSLVPALYDIVFVDSRTGVTEMGGICAYQLADTIVMFCAANHQNIEGTHNMATNFLSARVRALRANRPLQVIVIPARIDQRDPILLERFRQNFEQSFNEYRPPVFVDKGMSLWDLLIPYEPQYSFEERVVSKPEQIADRQHMATAFQKLGDAIALLASRDTALAHQGSNEERFAAPEPVYDITRRFAPYDALLIYHGDNHRAVMTLLERMSEIVGLRILTERWDMQTGPSRQGRLEDALFQSEVCVVAFGELGFGPWQNEVFWTALQARVRGGELTVIPVVLPGADVAWDRLTSVLTGHPPVVFHAEEDLTDVLRSLAQSIQAGSRPSPPRENLGRPYVGLQPFDEVDAPYYFGRERLIERLAEKVRSSPFVAVLGPSGSGKSSLVRAGLFPSLRQGTFPGSDTWFLRLLRPGSHPLVSLAKTLDSLRTDPTADDGEPIKPTQVIDERAFESAARTYLEIDEPASRLSEPHLVVFVDQFEEIFTVCLDERERQLFVDNLLYAANADHSRINVVIAMRADFLDECGRYGALFSWLQAHLILVPPMDAPELREAIERPAQVAGLAFEQGLVERILAEVADQPSVLPFLAFLLAQLWERRRDGWLTHEAYEAVGGVQSALGDYAERFYGTLSARERQLTQRIFVQLVRPEEGKSDTRRRATRTELGDAAWGVVAGLATARLVVTGREEGPEGLETVEIAHEALIRGWQRLQAWLKDDRAFRTWQERLRGALSQWEGSGRDPDTLIRGPLLEEATVWLAQRSDGVSAGERAFIAASVAERERAARRRQAVLIGSAIITLLAVIAASFAFAQWQDAQDQRQQAREQAQAAIAAMGTATTAQAAAQQNADRAATKAAIAATAQVEAENQSRTARSRQLAAQAAAQIGTHLDLALLLSLEALDAADTVEARGALLSGLATQPYLTTFLTDHSATVTSVALSPDGATLASGNEDGSIILWDVAGRKQFGTLRGHADTVTSVAFSPEGGALASSSEDGTVILWDVANRQQLGAPLIGHNEGVLDVAFSPDGSMVASGSTDRAIILWDVASHSQIGEPLRGHTNGVASVAFSPDGTMLASGSFDGTAILWKVADREQLRTFGGLAGAVYSLAFSPDGALLAVAGCGQHGNSPEFCILGKIRLWDAIDGKEIDALTGHIDKVASVAFSPDGSTLASGSYDGTIILWDVANLQQTDILRGHTSGVIGVTFSADGTTFASSSADNTVILWDVGDRQPLGTVLSGTVGGQIGVDFSPDGMTLASISDSGTVILWDVASRRQLGILAGDARRSGGLAFSPDGTTIASSGRDNTVILWDVASRRQLGTLTGHTNTINDVAFSPDGRILASSSEDGTTVLWDVASRQQFDAPLVGPGGAPWSLAFSPDGNALAVSSEDGTTILWDVASRQQLGTLAGHTQGVTGVAFSPDGAILASSSWDGTVILWDVSSHKQLGTLAGHTDGVLRVAFTPDGTTLASSGWDETVILWDVASRQQIGAPLTGHSRGVVGVAFNPNGTILASASWDGTVILWDVNLTTWKSLACLRANRNLNQDEWRQYFPSEPYRKTCPDLPGVEVFATPIASPFG